MYSVIPTSVQHFPSLTSNYRPRWLSIHDIIICWFLFLQFTSNLSSWCTPSLSSTSWQFYATKRSKTSGNRLVASIGIPPILGSSTGSLFVFPVQRCCCCWGYLVKIYLAAGTRYEALAQRQTVGNRFVHQLPQKAGETIS